MQMKTIMRCDYKPLSVKKKVLDVSHTVGRSIN